MYLSETLFFCSIFHDNQQNLGSIHCNEHVLQETCILCASQSERPIVGQVRFIATKHVHQDPVNTVCDLC